jgi:glycosyltransferase involved in cell wall biosynthesis
MRILLSASHRYPADGGSGVGLRPRPMPSGSAGHLHDLIARGLGERGHDVSYLPRQGADAPMPAGVRLVDRPDLEADVYHAALYGRFEPDPVGAAIEASGRVFLTTCHIERRSPDGSLPALPPRTIFVSPSLARAYGSTRVVWNGLDPNAYLQGNGRRDYLLFVAALDWAVEKGLETAIEAARRTARRLVVAGTGTTMRIIEEVTRVCREPHVDCVGDVRGREKAALYAGAEALLCPSRLNEGCPLTIIEALMSGTPVIASRNGACPDMLTPETGMVCDGVDDYVRAIERVGDLSPADCRRHAVARFDYRRMVADYLDVYRDALGTLTAGAGRAVSRA